MSGTTKAYIAGVGYTPFESSKSPDALISAATKALLDAGVTYDDVSRAVTGKNVKGGSEALKAFGDEAVEVDKVEDGSELGSAVKLVGSGEQCVLVVAADESAAVGCVLVSQDFLRRWPYLVDSSALVKTGDGSADTGLKQLCQTVWSLRGWQEQKDKQQKVGSLELSRADGQNPPSWKDVEHKQDGKHRLGYNPAKETKEIYQEDFLAVRATGKDAPSTNFKQEGGDRAVLSRQQKYMSKL